MTLPPWCPLCGTLPDPWDDTEATPCRNCGAYMQPLEGLTLSDRLRLQRMERLARARTVNVKGDVL